MCFLHGCFFSSLDFCWAEQPQCHVFLNCPPCYEEHKMIAFEIYNTRVIPSGFAEIAPINNTYWLFIIGF